MSILPADVVTDFISLQCSSLTSRKRVQRSRSRVRPGVITWWNIKSMERAHVEMIEVRVGRSTMSILGRSRTVSADAVRRLGPSVSPGNRIPIREKELDQ